MKHFFRILTIVLVVFFSISARESYGQDVSATVGIGTSYSASTSITICSGETVTMFATASTDEIEFLYWQYKNSSGVWVDFNVQFGAYHLYPFEQIFTSPDNKNARLYRARYFKVNSVTENYTNECSISIRPGSRAGGLVTRTYTICNGTTPPDMTLIGTVGTNIRWQSSFTSITGTYTDMSPAITTATLPGSAINNLQTGYYRAIVQNSNCPADTLSPPITVNVTPPSNGGTATIVSGTSTICYNTATPSITLSGSVGTVTWQSSTTPGSGFVDIAGTTSPVIDATASKYYRAKAISGDCSAAYSNEILITVNQASNAGTITPVTQTICYNAIPAAITISSYTGNIQWQSSLTAVGGYADIVGQTSATLPSGSISNTTTMYYQAVVTSGVCPSRTITATVNVDPTSVGGTATIASGTATICSSTTAPTITLAGQVGTVVWQSSSTSGSGFVDIGSGASPTVSNTNTKYYRAKVTSGVCSVAYSNEILITVNQASNAGTITPVTQTICYNAIPAAITISSYTGNIQWQSSLTAVGGYADIVGQTSATLPSGSISNTTTMYYQAVVTSGVCPSRTITATVNVDPTSVGGTATIASGTATICSSTTAPTITLAGQVGTVVWQSSSTSGSGFVDIGSGASPTVSNTNTKYYRAKVTSGVCSVAYSNEILITVNQASNAGTITPVTQTICYNAIPAAITISSYTGNIQWQSSLTAVGGYADIVGQTSATLPSGSISNTTTMYYQAVVTSGVCPSRTITATVNVDPTSVGGTATIASGTATICSSTTAPTITLAGQVGTVVWQSSSTSGSGFVDIGSGASPTVSNTNTKYYRAKVTSGVCSVAYSNEILITVNQASNAGTITPVTQTICYNAIPAAITISSYTGNIQWQSSLTAVGGYADIVGQTSATLPSGSISNTTTMYYQAVVTSGVCPSRTISATVNVNPTTVEGTAAITAGNATICANSPAPTITLSGSVGTIQWLRSGTLTGTYTAVAGTLTPTISNTTTGYYKASVRSGVCLTRETTPILISIDPISNYGTISSVAQTICYNATPTAISLTGYTGTIQWQYTNIAGGTYSDMTGQTGATLPTTAIDKTATGYYQAVVTSGVCAPAVINSTVNVTELSSAGVATITSGNATICSNTAGPVINLTGSIVGNVQWWERPVASPTLAQNNTPGATAPIINQTASKYYKAIVTNGICPSASSNEILVTVDLVSNAGSVNLPTQTICYNASPTALTLTGTVGTIQWQSSLTSNSGYNDLAGQTNTTLPSGSISNTSSQFYKAIVTSGVCPSATLTATVNVDLATVAGTATGTATICANSAAPTITLSGNVGSVIWQSANTSGGTFTTVAGTNNPTVDVTATKYYRALVKSGVCNSLPSNEILVTVNEGSSAGTVNLPTQTICYNATPTALTLTGSRGIIQWQSSLTSNSGYNDLAGQTNTTLPSGSISNTSSQFYKAIVTSGVCPSATLTATVNVDLATVAGTATGTATICANSAAPTITLSGNVGSVIWQSANTSGGTFTTVAGTNNPTVDVTATKYYRALVKSGVCAASPSNEILVTVDQASRTGTLNLSTQTICYNATPTALTLTNSLGTIKWQSSLTPNSGYNDIVGQTSTILPTGSISNTASQYYLAEVTNGVCVAATVTATVTVNPTSIAGTATLSGTSTICYGTLSGSLPSITLTGNTGLVQWQSSTSLGGVYTNTAGTTSPVIDNGNSKYYRALVTSGVCASIPSNELFVSVDQPSAPGNISPSTQDICIGNTPTPISLTGYVGTIQWQSSTTNSAGTFTNMVGETNNGLVASSIDNSNTKYYQAIVKNGVCPATPSIVAAVNISQPPVPGNVNLTGNSTVCYGTTGAGLPVITLSGSSGNIQWQSSSTSGGVYTNTAGTTSPVIDNTATKYYQAKVSSGPCGSATSIPIVVNVDPLSIAGNISNPAPRICQASAPADLTLSGYTGTIQWQSASLGGTYTNMVGLTSAILPSASIYNNSTFIYQAVVTSGVCPSATVSSTVTVDPTSVAGTSSLAGTSTVCYGTATASLPVITLAGNIGNIQWQSSSTSGGVYTNTAGTTSPVIDNTTSKYYRAQVTSGVCVADNSTPILVSVDPTSQVAPIITAEKIQEWCIGSPATAVTLPSYTGNIIWQTANTAGGTYTTIAGQTSATLTNTNIPTSVAGTLYYKAVVKSGVCPSIDSDIVTVQTDAATVAGSIASTSNLICNGSTPPTITLTGNTGSTIQWQTRRASAAYVNPIPSQAGTSINSVVNNSAPGTVQVVDYYQAIVKSGVCNSLTTNEVAVAIDPTSQVAPIIPAEKIQEWCIGSPATAVTLPGYAGNIIWQTANTAGGTYTTIAGQTTATLPNTNIPTNVAGTLYYKAVVTSGVCPSIDSDIVTVQTDAATVAGSIASTSNLICNGSTPPTITLTGNTGSTIQWQTRRASAAYVSPIPSQTGTSINSVVNNSAPGTVQVVDYYQAIVKSGVCNSLTTNEVAVAIDPASQVGLLDPLQKTQEVCIGSPATSVVLPSHTGTIQWQNASLGNPFGDMTGLTNATLPFGNISTNVAGTINYRAVVTSGVCPSIISEVASIQVDPATVAGSIASTSNLICNGSTPPTITLTGNIGSTIQWQTRRASAVYVNPIPAQAGTSINSVVNNSAPGTVQVVDYYQAIVKSGVCNSLTTNEVAVAIDPTSQVAPIIPAEKIQEWCIGTPATSITLPSYTGTIVWKTSNAALGSYSDIAGQTSATLPNTNIPTNVAGTLYYKAVVTSGVCPSIDSDIVTVQTDAATVAGDVYYLNGSSPICNLGVKPTISIKNNTGTNIVWQITTVSNSTSVITTANSLNYTNTINTGNLLNSAIDNTAPGAISSFKYYRASVRNGVCKTEYTAPIELEVIPSPVVTKVVPAERCGPGIVELFAESNLGTPNWYEASTGGTAVGIANSFTTPFLNTSTNFYAGAIFRGCVSLERTAVLAKIKPIPSITSVTNATYCGPGYLELNATASGGVINWYTDATGGATLLTAPKYTTPLLRSTTTYYAEALLDGCTSAPRAAVLATIFEVPTVTPLPDLYSLCAGLRVSLKNNASLGVPPYSYTFFTNNGNVLGQKDGYILGVKGGVTNVYFNVKDMNGCVSQNTNTFQVKTYDPVLPQRFNYQAFYKDNFLIPTKLDSGYVLYNWQPALNLNFNDKPNPIFNGENTTDYVLIRTDTTSKCTVADNYHIDVTRDFIFDLPNAFTPNYDGLNDVIKSIKNAGIDKVTSLSIFNRYGTKVCCTMSEIENGWNGSVNGKVQDSDGYFWIATFETKDGRTLTKKGSFLLIK